MQSIFHSQTLQYTSVMSMQGEISVILNKLLDHGIVIHGEVKLDQLTLTSIHRAKALGILSNESSEDEIFLEEETNSHLEPQHDVLNNEVVTREEFQAMMEELNELKTLIRTSQYRVRERIPQSRRRK